VAFILERNGGYQHVPGVQQRYYISDAEEEQFKKKGQTEAAGKGAPPSPGRG